jgi:hypothetical protein
MLFLIISIVVNMRYLIGKCNKEVARKTLFCTFLLPFRTHLVYLSKMATQHPTAAPDQFVRLLRKSPMSRRKQLPTTHRLGNLPGLLLAGGVKAGALACFLVNRIIHSAADAAED